MSGPSQNAGIVSRLTAGRAFKLFKFLAAGLPAFLVAVPLNYLLVEHAGLNKGLAYAIVLVAQVSANFVLCRLFVFEKKSNQPVLVEFFWFLSGMAGFRLADWVVYFVLTNFYGLPYLAVQLGNVVVFSVLKFVFAERVLK